MLTHDPVPVEMKAMYPGVPLVGPLPGLAFTLQ